MTWADFKAHIEKLGVKDNTDIDYIDVSLYGMEAEGNVFVHATSSTANSVAVNDSKGIL